MTARDEWKWTDEQGVQRVVRTDELRAAILSGRVAASILVWREGMKEWLPASAIPELARGLTLPVLPHVHAGTNNAPSAKLPKHESALPARAGAPRVQTLLGIPAPPPEAPAMPVPKLPSGRKATLRGAVAGPPAKSPQDDSPSRTQVSPLKAASRQSGKSSTPPRAGTTAAKRGRPATERLPSRAAPAAATTPPMPVALPKPTPPPPKQVAAPYPEHSRRAADDDGEVTTTATMQLPDPQGMALPAFPAAPLPPPAPPPPRAELPHSPQELAAQLQAREGTPERPADEMEIHSTDFEPVAPVPEMSRTMRLEGLPTGDTADSNEGAAAPDPRAIDDPPTAPLPDDFGPALQADRDSLSGHPVRQPVSVPMASLLGAGGALIGMIITAFFVGRCSASTAAGQVPLVRTALNAAPHIVANAKPPPPKPCWVARQPSKWAAQASKSIPFEMLATASGNVALGYATDTNRAVGIEIVPSSGEVIDKFSDTPTAEIERVTPADGGAGFTVATSAGSATMKSIVHVPAPVPFVIGLANGSISIADNPDAASSPLWPLEGETRLDAARVQKAGDAGYALVFRRNNTIWSGWIGPDHKPSGELVQVVGSSGRVGKPMNGWNRRELALVFADRPSQDAAWEIRAAHAPTGSIPQATSVIALPPGGPGGDAFAPDITGLPDGRWLLLWTEGPPGAKAVRAQTLAPDFSPLGDPIALSPPAGSFGQGVLGVAGSYVAAVFLSRGATSFELWGAVLQCG